MKNQQTTEKSQNKIFTVPNVLSFFRLCLIPLMVWLYCAEQQYWWTAGVLVLSGLTDVVDGYIARRFHMVSDLGKVLDPVADKLTQGVMLLCLITRFPRMVIPLVLFILKEIFAVVTGILVIKKTGEVFCAKWYGKAATASLYAMMFFHAVWYEIPAAFSDALIVLCTAAIALSFVMYGILNIKKLTGRATKMDT